MKEAIVLTQPCPPLRKVLYTVRLSFLFLLTLAFGSLEGFSQEQRMPIDTALMAVCYIHTVQTEDAEGKAVCDSAFTILEIGENVAKYGDFSGYHNNFINRQYGYVPEGFRSIFADEDARANDMIQVYQDYPAAGKYTVREYLFPKWYVYEEPHLPEWVAGNERDNIMGYPCKALHTELGGRSWTVWYAEDIPAPYGPWKFFGTPGLVLKAVSQDGVHKFSCYALFPIKQEQTIDFIKDETDDLPTNARKFIPLRNKLKSHSDWVKYPYYYARDAIRNWVEFTPNNKYGIKPCQVINGVVFANTRDKFQPLELK